MEFCTGQFSRLSSVLPWFGGFRLGESGLFYCSSVSAVASFNAGKETDVASKEEIGGPRATRCFMQLDNVPGGPCGHCGTRTSSAWRKGPVGKDELCNQCGARYIQKGTLHGFFPIQRGGAKAGPPSGAPPCRDGATRAAA